MVASLPDWPPHLTPDQESHLCRLARDYALAHSLVLRAPTDTAGGVAFNDRVVHAPFTLFPTPWPKDCLNLAQRLQSSYNKLYAQVASSETFLRTVLEPVCRVDEFTKSLFQVYDKVCEQQLQHQWTLGLFRSDYLLHHTNDALGIRQVEFNTISSSFGPLTSRVSDLHQYLFKMGAYPLHDALALDRIPSNPALLALSDGLYSAHETYLTSQRTVASKESASQPAILFVIQPHERNAFDQRLLEYELINRHQIRVIRQTFTQLASSAHLSKDNTLRVTHVTTTISDHIEISVVYYRSGYAPTDYTSTEDWNTRTLLECSQSVKCPSISLQLAGCKKIQQTLTGERILEEFDQLSRQEREDIKTTWTELYPLDTSQWGQIGYEIATNPEKVGDYVLKPQREGGGNNVYGSKVKKVIEEMEVRDREKETSSTSGNEVKEREGYILMSMIRPPQGLKSYLVRADPSAVGGEEDESSVKAVEKEVVSELGVYGVVVYRPVQGHAKAEVKVDGGGCSGWLLRTKAATDEEGGVAVGISCLDSPLLV